MTDTDPCAECERELAIGRAQIQVARELFEEAMRVKAEFNSLYAVASAARAVVAGGPIDPLKAALHVLDDAGAAEVKKVP